MWLLCCCFFVRHSVVFTFIFLENIKPILVSWSLGSLGPLWFIWKWSSAHVYARGRITRTYLYYFDPLKPHFYIVKLGFTGVYINFLISAQNIDCGYSLEPPRRGGSNEYPQSMFWAEIRKISEFFIWKYSFLGDKIFSMFE